MAAHNWTKGKVIGLEGGGSVTFFYNPQMIKLGKKARWNHIKAAGRTNPVMQYGCGDAETIGFNVDLTRAGGDDYVKSSINKLKGMCKAIVKGAGVDRPPRVKFILGSAIDFEAILEDVKGTYGPLYNPDGLNPYFGKVTLLLTEIKDE